MKRKNNDGHMGTNRDEERTHFWVGFIHLVTTRKIWVDSKCVTCEWPHLKKKKIPLGIFICFLCKWFTSLPKNWVHLLVGIKPKDTIKPKTGRRKGSLLAQVRRTLRIFLKAGSPQEQNWGNFKLRVHAYSWRDKGVCIFMVGLKQREILHGLRAKVDRVQALVDWSNEGQQRSASSLLRPQWIRWLSTQWDLDPVKLLKNVFQANLYLQNRTESLYNG